MELQLVQFLFTMDENHLTDKTKNYNDGYLLGGCISFCSVFSLDLSSHCLEASGTNTPLQSKNDMVSIAPFNLNIVPAK